MKLSKVERHALDIALGLMDELEFIQNLHPKPCCDINSIKSKLNSYRWVLKKAEVIENEK